MADARENPEQSKKCSGLRYIDPNSRPTDGRAHFLSIHYCRNKRTGIPAEVPITPRARPGGLLGKKQAAFRSRFGGLNDALGGGGFHGRARNQRPLNPQVLLRVDGEAERIRGARCCHLERGLSITWNGMPGSRCKGGLIATRKTRGAERWQWRLWFLARVLSSRLQAAHTQGLRLSAVPGIGIKKAGVFRYPKKPRRLQLRTRGPATAFVPALRPAPRRFPLQNYRRNRRSRATANGCNAPIHSQTEGTERASACLFQRPAPRASEGTDPPGEVQARPQPDQRREDRPCHHERYGRENTG